MQQELIVSVVANNLSEKEVFNSYVATGEELLGN
jgi:hypothetical protein